MVKAIPLSKGRVCERALGNEAVDLQWVDCPAARQAQIRVVLISHPELGTLTHALYRKERVKDCET